MKKTAIAVVLCIALMCCVGCRRSEPSSVQESSAASASVSSDAAADSAVSGQSALDGTSSQSASTESPSSAAASTPDSAVSKLQTQSQPVLVSLGDSITAGYGLSDVASQRYSARLGVSLSSEGKTWADCNYGVSGYTSSDLLMQLREGKIEQLKNADKVIICIGANNVLGPATALMKEIIAFGVDENGAMHFQAQDRDVSAEYRAFNQQAQQGVQQFASDLPKILSYIRSVNTSAQITLLTIYNPYKNLDLSMNLGGLPTPLSVISDSQVSSLNKVIRAQAQSYGCMVADVYSAFNGSSEVLVNADESSSAFPDPHPNKRGHEVIAQTVLRAAS